MSDRLYRLDVTYPEAAFIEAEPGEFSLSTTYVPANWEPTAEMPAFFWPKADRIYKSRSAATDRANLLRHYGCTVQVMECTPQWLPVEIANRRRKAARLRAKQDRLYVTVDALERMIDALDTEAQ